MNRILIFLLSFLSLNAFGQIKISQFPTYSGDASDAWVPGIVGTTNYKFAGKNFAWHKLDSITVSNDTVYQWKRGTRYFGFKLPAGGAGTVNSVFGRTGVVVAVESDYQAYYPRLSQTYANPAWISSLAWSKITGAPSYLLISDTATMLLNYRHWLAGYLTQAAGDARYPQLSGSYANPSWITSLPWSKITGAPTVGADLSYSVNATTVTINSNTGTDVVLPAANNTVAGVMTAEMVRKIDTLSAGDSVKFSRSNDSVYMCVKPFGAASYTCYFQYKDSVGAGAGATDISISRTATTVTVNSNTGADGVIAVVDGTNAGVVPAAQFVNDQTVTTRNNPTGTITHTYGTNGAQEHWIFTDPGARTLALSGMVEGKVMLVQVTNSSGVDVTVNLPASSYVNGASAASIVVPTGVSRFALGLITGGNNYFLQDGAATTAFYQIFQRWGIPMTQQEAANFNYPFDLIDGDGRTDVHFIERKYDQVSTWSQANQGVFYSTSSGTGSAAALMTTGNTVAGYTGGLILSTGTTVGGFGATYVGSTAGTRIPFSLDSNIRFNWTIEFALPVLSNGTDRYEFWSGMGEYTVPFSSNTDGIGVRYRDDDSSGQLIVYAESNNSKSERATGITVVAGVTYTVELSAYKGQVECYVKATTGNRVKAPVITSNVPTGTARQSNLLTVFYKIAGTANVDMYLKSTGFGTQTY